MWCLGLVVGPEKLKLRVASASRKPNLPVLFFSITAALTTLGAHAIFFRMSPKNEVSMKIQDPRQQHHWQLRHCSQGLAKCTKS